MYDVVMVEFDEMLFMKVSHEVQEVVVGMDVFQLKEGQVIQISPGVLSPQDEGKLISGVYDRTPAPFELEMLKEIFKSRSLYALEKTMQHIQALGEITLLSLVEVGGRFFAYTAHENLHYNRVAEVVLAPNDLPAGMGEVPKDLLPIVCEKLVDKMLPEKNKGVTIQIGEGLFVRLRRHASTIFATVVILETKDGEVNRVSAPLGFALSLRDGEWKVLAEDPEFTGKIHEEMQKAFDHVINELALIPVERS